MSFPLLVQVPPEEWHRLLADWEWLVPATFLPLSATLFGDAFLLGNKGEVQFLDALQGQLTPVAESEAAFQELLQTSKGRELLRADLAEVLWAKGLCPREDECYGYRIPPILGGNVIPGNIQVFPRNVYMSTQGQLHRQFQGNPRPAQ
jgi:hypothetical protein